MSDPITDFILFAKMCDLDQDHLRLDREIVTYDMDDPLFKSQRRFLGEHYTEVVAYALRLSWVLEELNPNNQIDELFDFVVPYWERLVAACPSLAAFWVPYDGRVRSLLKDLESV